MSEFSSEKEKKARSLPALALRRPVTVLMGMVTLVILGLVSWSSLPLEFMIDFHRPSLGISIPYPGATPEQVVEEIAVPCEGIFKTIPGLEYISTHAHGGGCSVWMRFAWDAEMAYISAETRDRIERLKLVIPQEIQHLYLYRFEPNAIPVLQMALFRAEREDELARYARTVLRNRLLRLEGVAEVQVSGQDADSIYVDFDQNALNRHRLSIYEVVGALRAHNVNMGVGELSDGRQTHYVRVQDEFTTAEDLAQTVVTPSGIRLRDVADVRVEPPPGAGVFSIDGKRGVFVNVVKDAESNTVDTCRRIRAELEVVKTLPEFAGTDMFVFIDHAEIIAMALDGLYLAGVFGSVMAFAILFVFLRKMRTTLVVALAIPCSLLVAPTYIFFAGGSLNLITLAAMLISIGALVDNAIVVVENMHRHEQDGMGARESARHGAGEVALAITAATLTTLVVFVPVLYMTAGELSSIMREFAGPISVSLVASLVMALTVLPVAEVYLTPHHILRRAVERSGHDRLFARMRARVPVPLLRVWRSGPVQAAAHPLRTVQVYYVELLAASLRWRFLVVAATFALLVTTYVLPYSATGFRGMPDLDLRLVNVQFNADPNYGYENVGETMAQLETIISRQREALGIRNIYLNWGGGGGRIAVYLVKPEEMPDDAPEPPTTDEVRRRLAELLPARLPGGVVDCGITETNPDSSRSVRVRLRGPDNERVKELAADFLVRMRALPELQGAKSGLPEDREEIQLRVDDERAAAVGISPLMIANSVDFALRGATLAYMKRGNREIQVRGQLAWSDRGTTGDLERMALPAADGEMLLLSSLVDMHKGGTPPDVQRIDARSSVELRANIEEADLVPVRAALGEIIESFEVPAGYTVELGDNLRNIDETLEEFNATLLMAIALIYLLLAALFESWLLPLSVLATVPLAYIGMYWALYLTGTPLDTISLVGSVFLCGVIVNNGIVIVDHINRLRAEGLPRAEAVVRGGNNRLRPVLMTTLTTILGILPLAFGGTAGGALDALGRTLVGGLTAGSAFTLFVVPVVYTLFDDLRAWCRAYFGGLARLGGAPAPE